MTAVIVSVMSGLAAGICLVARHRLQIRQKLAGERAAALAGYPVNLSNALSRSTFRELSKLLTAAAEAELRRLAGQVVSAVKSGPMPVSSITRSPQVPDGIRVSFVIGWQLTLIGIDPSTQKQLMSAVLRGILLTDAELVDSMGTRVRLSWDINGVFRHTLCYITVLKCPTDRSVI